jgi:hypothetical protein
VPSEATGAVGRRRARAGARARGGGGNGGRCGSGWRAEGERPAFIGGFGVRG